MALTNKQRQAIYDILPNIPQIYVCEVLDVVDFVLGKEQTNVCIHKPKSAK